MLRCFGSGRRLKKKLGRPGAILDWHVRSLEFRTSDSFPVFTRFSPIPRKGSEETLRGAFPLSFVFAIDADIETHKLIEGSEETLRGRYIASLGNNLVYPL